MNGNSEVQLYIIIALLTLTQHIENRNKTKEHFPKTDKLIKKRETNKMNEQNPKVKRQNPGLFVSKRRVGIRNDNKDIIGNGFANH